MAISCPDSPQNGLAVLFLVCVLISLSILAVIRMEQGEVGHRVSLDDATDEAAAPEDLIDVERYLGAEGRRTDHAAGAGRRREEIMQATGLHNPFPSRPDEPDESPDRA